MDTLFLVTQNKLLPTVCLGQHITQARSIFGGKYKTEMPGSFCTPGAVSPSEPGGKETLALFSGAITVLTEPMNLGVRNEFKFQSCH